MRNADLAEMVVMLCEVGMDLKEALESVKGVKQHRNKLAAQKSVDVRKKKHEAREKQKAYDIKDFTLKRVIACSKMKHERKMWSNGM
jgi:hypothetical protein